MVSMPGQERHKLQIELPATRISKSLDQFSGILSFWLHLAGLGSPFARRLGQMKPIERQDDEGEVLAYFGKARLVEKLDRKLELLAGNAEDRTVLGTDSLPHIRIFGGSIIRAG